MKVPFRALLLCTAVLAGQQAMAATTTANFNASVTLTSACRIKTGSTTQTLNFGTYTAFQSTAVTPTAIDIEFECTRGLSATPTVAFDAGTDMTTSAAGATATGAGVVAGLNYTLAVAAGVKTVGTAATTSAIGTADVYKYAVSGSMPAGQAGTSASGAQTQVRQLVITY